KELEPTLCGEAYLVVAPRDHDDWKSKVFRMTSKRRAVLSRRYGIDDNRVNPVVSPQKIAHGRAGWHSTDAVAAVLKHVGYQFSHGVVMFHEKNVLGLGFAHDRLPEAVVLAFTLASQDRSGNSTIIVQESRALREVRNGRATEVTEVAAGQVGIPQMTISSSAVCAIRRRGTGKFLRTDPHRASIPSCRIRSSQIHCNQIRYSQIRSIGVRRIRTCCNQIRWSRIRSSRAKASCQRRPPRPVV